VPFFVNVFRPYKGESRRPSFSESRRLQRACLGNGAVVVSHTSLLPRSQVLLIEKIRSSLPKPSFLNSLFGLDFFQKIKKRVMCVYKIGRLNIQCSFLDTQRLVLPKRKFLAPPEITFVWGILLHSFHRGWGGILPFISFGRELLC
jgi:hypothetical protein